MNRKFRIKHDKDGLFYVEELKEVITEKKVITNWFLNYISKGYLGMHYETETKEEWVSHSKVSRDKYVYNVFTSLDTAKEYIKRQIELPKYYDYEN